MTLKYYIDSQICRGFFVGEDLYIESEIKSLEDLRDMNEQATSLMQLTVLKVSNTSIPKNDLISNTSFVEEQEDVIELNDLKPKESVQTILASPQVQRFRPQDKEKV